MTEVERVFAEGLLEVVEMDYLKRLGLSKVNMKMLNDFEELYLSDKDVEEFSDTFIMGYAVGRLGVSFDDELISNMCFNNTLILAKQLLEESK